ncbi:class I SAM-dependent methyltransferase [Mucilaginibacter sp. ZT4R22]|uniref:Class I SAM-dependent methyltransferase n=1 Tax=Mucilaginibacter pankratovii TaxID=2772110 RepID=A0ABR7WW62_9SPHI|nr:class I SAM-dependent methyltransferase [Mucilaginibacter pankratovii]MBD1366520.1 class I SAM-dependent methyltransferase [Mucilaginibacter pankratovii]
MEENIQAHWEKVYQTKSPEEISWTQKVPQTSLDLINSFNLPKNARIIDIGGGDSTLVDHLLQAGFTNLTVLDISEAALQKVKLRLGDKGISVKCVVSDITEFEPEESYDLWHDRATFHFLTDEAQIATYKSIAAKSVKQYLIIGAFSENGPERCSSLPVRRYSSGQLQDQFYHDFTNLSCTIEDHITPFGTKQNFVFCSFKKR